MDHCHARRAPEILAEALPEFDEELCLRLLPIVRQMDAVVGNRVFLAMALHNSAVVRGRAFGILEQRNQLDPLALFPLINDPDDHIRETILTLLSKQRNEQYEQQLLTYLQNGGNTSAEKEHLLACYKALGRCGSQQSIPVLKEILTGGKLGTMFSRDAMHHKQGAAIALHELGIAQADRILQEGAAGILPDVRLACKKALGR